MDASCPPLAPPPLCPICCQALVYVVDTPRTANPTTFMSNMLYACSVLYKSRLPLVLALNKVRGLIILYTTHVLDAFHTSSELVY